VLLSGEAGIGKSRLTAALMEKLSSSESHTRLRYFWSPQRADSALYPMISQMERAAGLAHDDTRAEKAEATRRAYRNDFELFRASCSARGVRGGVMCMWCTFAERSATWGTL
jgi:hypothetical protein